MPSTRPASPSRSTPLSKVGIPRTHTRPTDPGPMRVREARASAPRRCRRACHSARREDLAGRHTRRRGAGSGTPGTCTGASGPGERRCQRGREVRGVLRRWALLTHPTVAHVRVRAWPGRVPPSRRSETAWRRLGRTSLWGARGASCAARERLRVGGGGRAGGEDGGGDADDRGDERYERPGAVAIEKFGGRPAGSGNGVDDGATMATT